MNDASPSRRSRVERIEGKPADDKHSLRPLTIKELLKHVAPRWLVRRILHERGLAVVFGATGSGKTFLVFDLAAAIARDDVEWLRRRVHHGGVIYVASEGHLQLRVQAYLKHNELDEDALSRLRVVPSSVNFLREDGDDLAALIGEIKKAAKEMGVVVLIVLDTLNSMMPGGNENSSEDMGRMIAAARRISEALGCAVLYVHHTGKDEQKGSRGHSSLKAALDTEIQVTDVGGERIVEVLKVRDGEPGQKLGFKLEVIDLGPDPDPEAKGELINSCVVVPLDFAPTPRTKDAKAGATSKRSKGAMTAFDALTDAILEHGQPHNGLMSVESHHWIDAFHARRGDDAEPLPEEGKAREKAKDRRSTAFRRAKDELVDDKLIAFDGSLVFKTVHG